MSRTGKQGDRPAIARDIARACNSGAILSSQGAGWRRPCRRKSDFGVASVNYALAELLAKAEEPR